MLYLLVILFIFVAISISFSNVFASDSRSMPYVSKETLLLLLLIYFTLLISFGLLYTVLHIEGIPVLVENGVEITGNYFNIFTHSVYFSAVTILTVGYGDVTPVGIGRVIAMAEALIGFVMPAAFVVRVVLHMDGREGKKK
ncbi:potassium channel LctB [Bacillus tianshenii]|uniref:Potassium channel LctB n=1 Tax=Sutcliffiella tianshenii TaxID=1463404 RepID=A0ABS2NYJ4_9BACI|nr:potassium channel family protein [Bacillus tianshenii]MBM7619583.1 potassium channel LctB [Bacillus tianshenii]MCA1321055.1 potassium channel family protein [Bacillus tianshenii]